jgi:transcriptional regulator with XRE-family HTH domain
MNRELIRAWLKSRGMRQNFFAAQVGLTPGYMSAILGGRKRPSIEVLARIADVTGYSADELLGRQVAPRRRPALHWRQVPALAQSGRANDGA